jgi:ABC-2 type transport system ATP-binding protein
MVIVDNITKVYSAGKGASGVKALEGISFKLEPGEVCGYLGANGAGKSTTIKIMCGMLKADSGIVTVNGISIDENPNKVKQMIGYVPESGALFLSLSPYDFLEFVCRMYDMDKEVYNHRIFTFMDMFDLKNEIRTPMHTFSKGMRQKVLLISSLIHNPEVILWDEPLSGIDYSTTIIVRNLIKELSAAGKTFFYSTHLIESIDKVCSKVIILNSGRIAYEGSLEGTNGEKPEDIMKKYASSGDISEKMPGLYNNISARKE